MIRLAIAVLGCAIAFAVEAAQQQMRFSLPVPLIDFSNSVAKPGDIRVPLSETNVSLEIVDWKAGKTSSNAPGEFLLKLKRPFAVGTLIGYEAGQVSYLSSNQWKQLPAGIEQGRKLQVLPLPPGERVEAFKFAVPAQATKDKQFQATLPFVTLIPVRAINIAPQAKISSSSTNQNSSPKGLSDGLIDPVQNFSTAVRRTPLSAESPESILLAWDEPQAFRGLAFFRGKDEKGLGRGLVENFIGNENPATSGSTNSWEPVIGRSTAPGLFRSNEFFVSFNILTTRGIRITSTGQVDRVSLGEIVVFRDLGFEPVPEKLARSSTPSTASAAKDYTISLVASNQIKVDGKTNDWPAGRANGFALAYDAERFYVLYQAEGKEAAFQNKGTNLVHIFSTGDVVDVQLQTRAGLPAGRPDASFGDIRLCFSMFEGRPVCVFYDYNSPNFDDVPITFQSDVKRITCDKVYELKEAAIQISRTETNLTLEASVPFKAIHLNPKSPKQTRGDFGRIFSDPTGTRAIRRAFWANSNATALGDLASQAGLQPAFWGSIKFEQAP